MTNHYVSFTLQLDAAEYVNDPAATTAAMLNARLTIAAKLVPPLVIEFFSRQYVDLIVLDDALNEGTRWSRGKVFPMIASSVTIDGSKHWDVALPLTGETGSQLAPGRYVAKALLMTHTDESIRNKTGFAPLQHAASLAFTIRTP